MKGKKLLRMIAVCTACLGVFAFTGCHKRVDEGGKGDETNTEQSGNTGNTGNTDNTGSSGSTENTGSTGNQGSDNQNQGSQNQGSGSDEESSTNQGNQGSDGEGSGGDDGQGSDDEGKQDSDDDGSDDTGSGKEDDEGKDPVTTGPVQGGPTITKYSSAELETAYVEWTEAANAKWYSVYCSSANANDWKKIDAPLVRQYADHFRADVVGLKAGTYDLKVVPVSADGEEAAQFAKSVSGITVTAHDRAGFAFVNGTASGAYNDDGTLKADANVIYVTDATKDSVSLEMKSGTVKGIQNILDAQKKEGKPLSVRLIGNVTSPNISESKSNNNNKNDNTLLIKGDGKGGNLAVTFEGIGNDATVNGWTLRVTSSTNVEVRNLGFMSTKAGEPDDVTLEKDNHVWVHNCDFFYGGAGGDSDQAKGDGALDTKESTYITHSYNHFWDNGKSNLQNMHEEGDWRITYHHNWYDHSDSRHPRIRSATVHVYNNYFDGNAKYGVGACEGANVFVENNYFRNTVGLKPMMSSKQGTDLLNAENGNPDKGTFSGEDGGMIKAFGNAFVCPEGKLQLITQNDTDDKTNLDCYLASSRTELVPDAYVTKYGATPYSNFDTANDMYEYTVDTAEQAKIKVERYAGRIDGGDFKWEFDDAKEDSNSSIITALKTALINYKSGLVKVDGETVSSGTAGGNQGGSSEEETGGTVGELPADTAIILLGDKQTYPAGVKVEGNYKSGEPYTYGGESYNPLKMESGTSVKITLTEPKTIKIYLTVNKAGANGKKIKVDGVNYTADSNGFVTVEIKEAKTVEITKGDSIYLCYIQII